VLIGPKTVSSRDTSLAGNITVTYDRSPLPVCGYLRAVLPLWQGRPTVDLRSLA